MAKIQITTTFANLLSEVAAKLGSGWKYDTTLKALYKDDSYAYKPALFLKSESGTNYTIAGGWLQPNGSHYIDSTSQLSTYFRTLETTVYADIYTGPNGSIAIGHSTTYSSEPILPFIFVSSVDYTETDKSKWQTVGFAYNTTTRCVPGVSSVTTFNTASMFGRGSTVNTHNDGNYALLRLPDSYTGKYHNDMFFMFAKADTTLPNVVGQASFRFVAADGKGGQYFWFK